MMSTTALKSSTCDVAAHRVDVAMLLGSFKGWMQVLIRVLLAHKATIRPGDRFHPVPYYLVPLPEEQPVVDFGMRDAGVRFGLELVETVSRGLAEMIEIERTAGFEPQLALNIHAFLVEYAKAAEKITLVHLQTGGHVTPARVAHWSAALGAFVSEVVKTIGMMLIDAANRLGTPDLAESWIDGLSGVVQAFVYPDAVEKSQTKAWVQERLDLYEEIRIAVRQSEGWDAGAPPPGGGTPISLAA